MFPGPKYWLILVLACALPHAYAQYPTKPIRLVIGSFPGGASPERFGAFRKAEEARRARVIKQAGITAQ